MFRAIIAAVSLGFVLAAPALAQQLTAQDFVTQAASGGIYEVQSSQLVIGAADAPAEVGAFAERMIEDHTQANEQLMMLAQ